tara:strand:+ start:174 stop:653 length:480 start_codon:yes stop_codon:yes gene_type:complete
MSQIKVNSIIPVAGVPTGGGGGIIQIKSVTKTGEFSSGSTSYVDITGCTVNITPTSSTSKIYVTLLGGQFGMYSGGSYYSLAKIVRDSTDLVFGIVSYRDGSGHGNDGGTCALSYLDSPNTTSQVTYKAQVKSSVSGRNVYPTGSDGEGLTITVMEVSA